MRPFSPASGPVLSVCSRGDAFMAMPQTVPPKEKASETFAFEFQKTQRISLQTLLSQRARPLSQSLSALPAPPKWEPLAVPASFISLPRPLPLRKDFPRAGGRCRAATKGGVWICEAKTERARTLTLCSSFLNIIQSSRLTPPSVWPETLPPHSPP